jgi:hypothetical protein
MRDSYVRVCQEILIIVIFLGGSRPSASVTAESRPWPVKCQVCVERDWVSTDRFPVF